ncbi:DUF2780 domain-containing protein [Parendozoicomonas haliclonae]|uniref:DUF2780 domain-containing protein n=1 Tax=Parendozoicomonas haliclonae TaxID=1960125 RepID=A0A1X7AL84_9GAMM|nr:DUF2780 domain-containing protein [Parendozoicomonas haliclonae]SMA48222.1 hypothetical protein EHSB41UT_02654 [Parendozoicomonas haliclonae]
MSLRSLPFRTLRLAGALLLSTSLMLSGPVAAEEQPPVLMPEIMEQLNISKEQANASMTALLAFAKEQMDAGHFDKLVAAMPETMALVQSLPEKAEESGFSLSKLTGGASELLSQLQEQGLNAEKMQQFVDMIVQYVKENDAEIAQTLKETIPTNVEDAKSAVLKFLQEQE